MGISVNCIDRFGMRKPVLCVDDSSSPSYFYCDDFVHDVYDDDPQRGFLNQLTIVNYLGIRVCEAARLLGQLSYWGGSTLGSVSALRIIRKYRKNSVSYSLRMSDGYIAGEVMCVADRLSRYHAAAVIAPLLPTLLVEHRWSEEYDRTIQSVRPVFFSQSVDLDLIFTPGYMAEVERSLEQYLGETDDSNNEVTVYSIQGW